MNPAPIFHLQSVSTPLLLLTHCGTIWTFKGRYTYVYNVQLDSKHTFWNALLCAESHSRGWIKLSRRASPKVPWPCSGLHIHVTSLDANHDDVKYSQNNKQGDKKSKGSSEKALFCSDVGILRFLVIHFHGFGFGLYSGFKHLMLSLLRAVFSSVRATAFLMMFLTDWMDDGSRRRRGPWWSETDCNSSSFEEIT